MNRFLFRKWLMDNYNKANECWVFLKTGIPKNDGEFYYLDAVEEALCFGWIDGVKKKVDGKYCQRFTPRRKTSFFSELNKARCRRLENLGLMTDPGRVALKQAKPFIIDDDIKNIIIKHNIEDILRTLPPLYVRIKISNIQRERCKTDLFKKMLNNFIDKTKKRELYGNWNDYGRITDYS